MQMKNKQIVLSLSGGMDSSTLLLYYLEKGYNCTCISFDYGQKHKVELERAKELVEYLNKNRFGDVLTESSSQLVEKLANVDFVEKYPKITHQIIKLDGLSNLLNSTLVEGGKEVPEGHYEEENMKDTVVPNRNKIFSSIVQAVALSIATKTNKPCNIALGIHAGDHQIYPDCRADFRAADLYAFQLGNWKSELVDYEAPYQNVYKFDILEDGLRCCERLKIDFDEVYKRTNTSYKPIRIGITYQGTFITAEGGVIRQPTTKYKTYSDYKSASSVERIEAFIKLGRPDPVEYADETGPVTWEVAKKHVEDLLKEKVAKIS